MFTGIVTNVGEILACEARSKNERAFLVATGFADLALGESIAINGVCLTVAEFLENGHASFYASPETLARTNLGTLDKGSLVNLERALRVGDRLSGHWVQGHVDGIGALASAHQTGEAWDLHVTYPESLARYFVEKGSVCINGVSLTINELGEDRTLGLMIIPHTWQHTNLSLLNPGDPVNLEVDILAKLMERQCLFAKP